MIQNSSLTVLTIPGRFSMPCACIVSHENSSQLLSLVLLPQDSFRVFCSPVSAVFKGFVVICLCVVVFVSCRGLLSFWVCSLYLSKHLGKVSLFLGVWGIYYMSNIDGSFHGSLKLLWQFSFCLILSQFCYIFVFAIFYAVKKYAVPLCYLDLQRNRRQRKC